MAAAKKESLRPLKLFPARSIEDTGLDSSSPHGIAVAKDGMLTTTSAAFIGEDRNRYSDAYCFERSASEPSLMREHIAGRRGLDASAGRAYTSGREVLESTKQNSKLGPKINRDYPSLSSRESTKDHSSDGTDDDGKNRIPTGRTVAGECMEHVDKDDIPDSLHQTVEQVDVCHVSHSEVDHSGKVSFPMSREKHRYGNLQPIMENFSADRESTDVRSMALADNDSNGVEWPQPSNAGASGLGKTSQSAVSVGQLKNSSDAGAQVIESPASSAARSRWKRVKHGVRFINHISANIRSPSTVDEMLQQQVSQDDAGCVGAATFEGAKAAGRMRCKGRKGMEGLLVQQHRSCLLGFQDFYVACLKMPISSFLVAVFLAPLALGLLFTPLYLLDVDGLSFNGVVPEDATTSPLASARQRCLAFLNIFLYALSLSTTFGGAPVAARSPYCLIVANMNTLMAQFLFVFLSGAVFARMSQPSYPIRCSKKAIIKIDDLIPALELEQQKKYRVLCVRLVLTGPSLCELVDVKIRLTFRIFTTLPSGYVFCSTHDLEVVRPEVSYLRYGLMVRHIIDTKSPVYGHTMDSLREGDASFSLTVMGLERTSMQSVFHLEDYFVSDDDVIWDGDYEDFIHRNEKGERVLDHSKIDKLKTCKDLSPQTQQEKIKQSGAKYEQKQNFFWPGRWLSMPRQRVLKMKSTSFTRADW